MPAKKRADILLQELGLAESRTKAQAIILSGKVYVSGRRVDKAGELISTEIELEIRGQDIPWVSRGGLKLDHAIKHFGISVAGKLCIDVGASTGGFTDVLLQNGARKVYSVDVGYGQLHEKIRNNPAVVVLERTNARYIDNSIIPEMADFICCDASFISLKTVLPAALQILAQGGEVVALIKPQFEAGKGKVGKGGVVRDSVVHQEICEDITSWFLASGFTVRGLTGSPVLGHKGNHEFLIWVSK